MDLTAGLRGRVERTVTAADTAVAIGSGDVPVLATPRLIAWCEAATVAALAGHLPGGSTSVGTHVDIRHDAACLVGAHVTVTAELVGVEGRQLRFEVTAADEAGRDLAVGVVVRAVVDRDRFLAGVRSPSSSAGTRPPDR